MGRPSGFRGSAIAACRFTGFLSLQCHLQEYQIHQNGDESTRIKLKMDLHGKFLEAQILGLAYVGGVFLPSGLGIKSQRPWLMGSGASLACMCEHLDGLMQGLLIVLVHLPCAVSLKLDR